MINTIRPDNTNISVDINIYIYIILKIAYNKYVDGK